MALATPFGRGQVLLIAFGSFALIWGPFLGAHPPLLGA